MAARTLKKNNKNNDALPWANKLKCQKVACRIENLDLFSYNFRKMI